MDRHHHALFHAMQRLFEDRLGYTVYTPLGHEWWDEGYWRFGEGYGDDRLARQFLNLDTEGEWTPVPGQAEGYRVFTGRDNHHPDREILGIELGAVLNTPQDWAFVVATVQDNQRGFRKLADDLTERNRLIPLTRADPLVKYVLQVGNTNQHVDWSLDPLALVSSEVPIRGKGIVIHQEMDPVFAWREPDRWVYSPVTTIRSFVNCFDSTPCYQPFVQMQDLLRDDHIELRSYGIDGTHGNVETVALIADFMATSLFGWHDKVQGDGFGHVLHDWAAIGRPLIGHGAHYRGLMGEVFWQDGVTCIDLDKHTLSEAAQMIRDIAADPPRHLEMCRAIRAVFDANVDFAAEAERVREFLA